MRKVTEARGASRDDRPRFPRILGVAVALAVCAACSSPPVDERAPAVVSSRGQLAESDWASAPADGPSFTRAPASARERGTHEIVLRGDAGAENPFETEATVTFVPPSGPSHLLTVDAFYDGGDTWRARVYVTEEGAWTWTASSAVDPVLDGQNGHFEAIASELPGLLGKDSANPRSWITADGRPFVNVGDTAYRLFHGTEAPAWRAFVRDSVVRGASSLRVASLGGWGGTAGVDEDDNNAWVWNDPWVGGAPPDYTRFDLSKFQETDARLVWIANEYPRVALQMILFSLKGYGSEATGEWWGRLPESVRTATMRYMIARWSAFPEIFWLVVNDLHCGERFPANRAFVREVGRFFATHEPWPHLISTGPERGGGFPFGPEDLDWVGYVHLEDRDAVGADSITDYGLDRLPVHVYLGEDIYEQDHERYDDPRFFFRWLQWSWLLSAGSANYCGRWGVIHPYTRTGRTDLTWRGASGQDFTGIPLVGMDAFPFIGRYFRERGIDLADFVPDDGRAADAAGRTGKLRPKLVRRGEDEFLIYHPNADESGYRAVPSDGRATLRIDLSPARGRFESEWYRPLDGLAVAGRSVEGGGVRELASPWPGQDVVLRLVAASR